MDCSLPGFSVHGILQERILEWVAVSFSRGSSQPRNQTQISCIAGRFFTDWAIKEIPPICINTWICFCLSDWLHPVWQSLGPSTPLQMAQFHSFLWLSNMRLLKNLCSLSPPPVSYFMLFKNIYTFILKIVRKEWVGCSLNLSLSFMHGGTCVCTRMGALFFFNHQTWCMWGFPKRFVRDVGSWVWILRLLSWYFQAGA